MNYIKSTAEEKIIAICQEVKKRVDNGEEIRNVIISISKEYNISPDEIRKEICREVGALIDKGMTSAEAQEEISKKYKVSTFSLKSWDKEFREFTSAHRRFSKNEKAEIRQKVIDLVEAGAPVVNATKVVAKEYDVGWQSIRNWDKGSRDFSKETKHSNSSERQVVVLKLKSLLSEGKKITKALELVGKEFNIYPMTIRRWTETHDVITKYKQALKLEKAKDVKVSKIRRWSKEKKEEICYTVKNIMELLDCNANQAIIYLRTINFDMPGDNRDVYAFNIECNRIFDTRKQGRKYDDDYREIICEEVTSLREEGKSQSEAIKIVSENYKIPESQIRKFDTQFRKFSKETEFKEFSEKEQERICSDVRKLIDTNIEIKRAKEITAKKEGCSIKQITEWNEKYQKYQEYLEYKEDKQQEMCVKVKSYVNQGMSIFDAVGIVAEEYNTCRDYIYAIDRKFRKFSSQRKEYSNNTKEYMCKELDRLIKSGFSKTKALEKLSKDYGIASVTIDKWYKDIMFTKAQTKIEQKMKNIIVKTVSDREQSIIIKHITGRTI